jgi:hypothetical protein
MKTRLKLSLAALLTLVLGFAWYGVTFLLNMPNTVADVAGFVGLLLMFILGPTGYWLIFRKEIKDVQTIVEEKSNEDSQQSTIA